MEDMYFDTECLDNFLYSSILVNFDVSQECCAHAEWDIDKCRRIDWIFHYEHTDTTVLVPESSSSLLNGYPIPGTCAPILFNCLFDSNNCLYYRNGLGK